MKIFITGATGFIRGYLVQELLKQDYEVKILSRNKSKTIPQTEQVVGDITGQKLLRMNYLIITKKQI